MFTCKPGRVFGIISRVALHDAAVLAVININKIIYNIIRRYNVLSLIWHEFDIGDKLC